MKRLLRWLMQNHSGWWEARLIFTAVLLFNEVCGGDCLGVWKTHFWWVWEAGYNHVWKNTQEKKELMLKCKLYSKAVGGETNWYSGNISFLTHQIWQLCQWSSASNYAALVNVQGSTSMLALIKMFDAQNTDIRTKTNCQHFWHSMEIQVFLNLCNVFIYLDV